jgi:Zn finger protein HypA/HybF involved in hydrogenase expression
MEILGDGTLFLKEGEPFPLVCPQCKGFIEFTDAPVVQCPHCSHSGPHVDFTDATFKMESREQ